jgi:tetratricopeptide (TPR) repeat protein
MVRSLMTVILVLLCSCSGQQEQAGAGSLPDFDALWDYDHPESTEAAFRRLLPVAQGSHDISYQAQLLTQIARAQGLQMNFPAAHRTLDSVEVMLTDRMPVARVRYLLERGRAYNSAGKVDSARRLFLEAWDLGRANGEDFYAVDAAHMMAIVGTPEEQLGWSRKAMEAAEQSSDERTKRWLGPLYNNTGWTYHDLGRYDEALELFEKSLAWNKEHGTDRTVRIARWTIGRVYRSLGRVEEALAIQQDLENEIKTRGLEPDGYVLEEVAECLLLLGRDDEARGYFASAYEVLSQDEWLMANEPARMTRIKELAGSGM